MTDNEQKLLNEIMDWYNFGKVASVMQHLNWTWHNCDSFGGIPVESDLRVKVREQFTRLMQGNTREERSVSAIGGFEYVVWRTPDGVVDVLELRFVVAEWSTIG